MSFAKNTIDSVSQFFGKNKTTVLTIAGLTIASGAVMGQEKKKTMDMVPTNIGSSSVKDSSHAAQIKRNRADLPEVQKQIKRDRRAARDNGFFTFNAGVKYTDNSIWNDGKQFDWHGNVPMGFRKGSFGHRFGQFVAGYTMRNKGMGLSASYVSPFGAGQFNTYYKPNEVHAATRWGPKIAINKDKHSKTAVVMPYVALTGSYGFGNRTNELSDMSFGYAGGVHAMVGKIGKLKTVNGKEKMAAPTVALSVFAEYGQEVYNNRSFGNRITNAFFPNLGPNAGPNPRNSLRAGVHIAICLQ